MCKHWELSVDSQNYDLQKKQISTLINNFGAPFIFFENQVIDGVVKCL